MGKTLSDTWKTVQNFLRNKFHANRRKNRTWHGTCWGQAACHVVTRWCWRGYTAALPLPPPRNSLNINGLQKKNWHESCLSKTRAKVRFYVVTDSGMITDQTIQTATIPKMSSENEVAFRDSIKSERAPSRLFVHTGIGQFPRLETDHVALLCQDVFRGAKHFVNGFVAIFASVSDNFKRGEIFLQDIHVFICWVCKLNRLFH